MKLTKLRTIAILSVAIALLGSVGLSMPANAADTRYITISATGSTNVVPDAVRIQASVSVIGKSSKEALATASTTASAVRKALTANKIATKDVATQSVSVYPEYTYPANGAQVLSGYRATQSFDITVRAASTAGAVVDAIVSAGGDNLQVNGASPFVLDNNKATQTARASAVARAKAKAASYAKLLGVKLGKVIYLDEASTPTPFPVFGVSAKSDESATQIDLGEQKVTVSVTVRWAIG
jgi:uncharacterized protein YggE